jgi:alkylglycerol monooxygenase
MVKWNIMAWSIPLFIGLMLVEYVYVRKRGLPFYHLPRSVANISIGLAERLADLFTAAIFYSWYQWLQQSFGLFTIKPTIGWWIMLLFATDFIWYWYHRLAHEVNILWAVHVVHHQSEDFNYTTSVRITVLQAFVRFGFWSVLPMLGFPAYMIAVLLLIHGIYPFFTHTQTIGRLGFLEYFMVTPSHQRVQHANNDKYLDKNYGDMFIIWDKLFGTFQKEEETPTYGLTKQLNSYSFL